ncbi:MAG: zinc ABC transporter substrate-binding protein [Drouetiella hepatica Uher 2000/2452]|uniref:Zinc ABC transporter substrate-binding protein n=1 Tax=Drouetiella hepatica Uher 2000/2452 TaxID=904376 RepID=A0A951Q8C2_9CYAN|nr:zinc ABC transporter substrate-binding protein [Drouetiella hepatica Uher 2000/2452]
MSKQCRVAPVVQSHTASATPTQGRFWSFATSLLTLFVLLPTLGCGAPQAASSSSVTPTGTSSETGSPSGDDPLQVVAAENFWGSLAAQVGGDKVKVTSLITSPDTDPHDYEPKPTDARLMASARYVILNGAGYDPWGQKLLESNPVGDRKALIIGDLVGKKEGDNPHLWYNPNYVMQVIDQITADFKELDPADAAYYDQERAEFIAVGLKDYLGTIAAIKQKYSGTPVGTTESIFAYLAEPLGLKLLTPAKFMNAVSEGEEPTAIDKSAVDQQLTQKQIKVLVFNAQNATPDTDALTQKAKTAGIPIVPVTETLTPANASFQEWQTAQLKALEAALAEAK